MNGVINHPSNTYYLELREDYVWLCTGIEKRNKSKSSSHCQALILAIMERWTSEKASKNKNLYISMTYPQWVESMYRMFGRSCVMDSLEELVEEGLLKRQSHSTGTGGRQSYKYLLNISEVNKRLTEFRKVESNEPHDPDSEEQYAAISINKNREPKIRTRVSYTEYLQSPEWDKRKQKAKRFAGFKCQICNSSEGLNVHHRTYERLGHEHMGDLTVLCKNCHEIFHNNGELTEADDE